MCRGGFETRLFTQPNFNPIRSAENETPDILTM